MAYDGLDAPKLLIGGELVDAEDGATYPNINPFTEDPIGSAADASTGDVDAAIGAARRAFDEGTWRTDLDFRVHCLRQLVHALEKNADTFKRVVRDEVGLPASIADPTFDNPVEILKWNISLLQSYEFSQDFGVASVAQHTSHRWTEREAIGVVATITPWNQPVQVNLAKVSPALAAGNAVILKAAPTTPWSASAMGKLVAEETDIPPGILNVITSSVNDRGEQLLSDPRVDMVSFTGSTAVGRHIMRQGADTIKKLFLELGGKSANIVLQDANFDEAIGASAFMVCVHGGQGCATLTRLLLPRSRFDEGVELARTLLSMMPYGDPSDPANLMGPLNSGPHRDRVEGFVERAKAAGSKPLLGGQRPPQFERGYFYEPTLIADMPDDAEITRNEIFGPVLCALPYDDEAHAIKMANDSIFGLSGAVFSGDREHSKAVARQIRAGTMIVDGGIYYGPEMPFGGYKQSGFGREMGKLGFEEYLQVKTLCEPV